MKNVKRTEINFLKFFVYMMGFVLIFATLFLTYIIYKKNFAYEITYSETKNKCASFNLNVGDKVQNITLENGLIHVIQKDESGNFKISIHDYCNGNLINEINVGDHTEDKIVDAPKNEDLEPDDKNILS